MASGGMLVAMLMAAGALQSFAMATAPKKGLAWGETGVAQQNFMATDKAQVSSDAQTNATAAGTAETKASVTPALQHSEVYDADFPVDMASKTPMELRYQAQADYAKAIQSLKREAAEAAAARKEMEKQLQELKAAEQAAANAKAAAERAARDAAALKKQLSKEEQEAAAAAGEANGAKKAISKEEADLAAATKAYEDAKAAEQNAEAKIEGMKKTHAELTAEIKTLEAEMAAANQEAQGASGGVAANQQQVAAAEKELAAAEANAATKGKTAAQSEAEAEAAKAKLAKAQAAAQGKGKGNAALTEEVKKAQQEYELAKETYTKEANDVKAAKDRVARAKAELAKWEVHSSASAAAPALLALVLGSLVTL